MAWRVKAKDIVVAAFFAAAMVFGLMSGRVLFPAIMALCMVFVLLPRPTPLIVRWRRWKERQSRSEPSD